MGTESDVAAPTGGRQRARWTGLAVVGLLMETTGPLLFIVAVLIWGLDFGDDIGFFAIIAAIPLVGTFLVWRFGWWARILGIVTAILPASAMFWTAFGLSYPGSFFDFVPGILVIPGMLIAVVGLIASLVAGRKGNLAPRATGRERLAIRLILALLGLLAIASGVLTVTGRSTSADAATADEEISSKNSQFEPREISVNGGDTILVSNDDPFFHTFTVEALEIDRELTPGDEETITIPEDPGTYIFYCRPHTENPEDPSDSDMAGTLTIR